MLNSEINIRVRYSETDRMGYVYYGHYAQYYEIGRTEMLRSLGLTYKQLEDEGYMLPIASLNIKYIKPALYDDMLTLKTTLKKSTGIKLEFDYELYNQDNELINTASTLLIFVDTATRRPVQAPEFFLSKLRDL